MRSSVENSMPYSPLDAFRSPEAGQLEARHLAVEPLRNVTTELQAEIKHSPLPDEAKGSEQVGLGDAPKRADRLHGRRPGHQSPALSTSSNLQTSRAASGEIRPST
jgi:hypothetical protein